MRKVRQQVVYAGVGLETHVDGLSQRYITECILLL